MSQSVRHRFVRGTVANFIAVAFNQGSTLVANVLVARALDKIAYGEYAIVVNTLLTIGALAQLSTGYTASKFIAEFREVDKSRAGRILGACAEFSMMSAAVGATFIAVFSPWIAADLFLAPHLALALVLGSGFLAASAINGYQMGALGGLEAFDRLAYAGIVSGIGAIICVATGAWLWGLNGAITGLSIAGIGRCLVHFWLLRRELKRQHIVAQYRGSLRAERSTFLRFTLPAALSGYITIPAIWLSNTILVRQSGGFDQMALFAASNNIRVIVLFVPLTANVVMMSIINNLLSESTQSRFRKAYGNNILITAAGAIMIAGIAGLLAPYLLQAFGPSFTAGVPIAYFLLGAAVGEALSTALYQAMLARSQIWRILLFIVLPREIVLVSSALLLVPHYGGEGLAAAYLCAWMLSAFITLIVSIITFTRSTEA